MVVLGMMVLTPIFSTSTFTVDTPEVSKVLWVYLCSGCMVVLRPIIGTIPTHITECAHFPKYCGCISTALADYGIVLRPISNTSTTHVHSGHVMRFQSAVDVFVYY